jgi:hypothetical protein
MKLPVELSRICVGSILCFAVAAVGGELLHLEPNGARSKLEVEIQKVIYRDLIEMHRSDKSVGAFFLETSDENRAQLAAAFTNRSPRVETRKENAIITKTGVVDRVSQKASVLLWARIQSNSVSTVNAVGGWYSGPESGASFKYRLQLSRTNWRVSMANAAEQVLKLRIENSLNDHAFGASVYQPNAESASECQVVSKNWVTSTFASPAAPISKAGSERVAGQ